MQEFFVIFDIDKTLIETSAAHMQAYRDAFKAVCQIDTGIDGVEHHGRTELWIIPEVLRLNGWKDADIQAALPHYFVSLEQAFQQRFAAETPRVLPGVVNLLESLSQQGAVLAVVTGNSEGIAHTKLSKARLGKYFTTGAFGDEAVSRTDLVKLARQRAENAKGPLGPKALFGDAPPDVAAGHEAQFTTVGVTTGEYSQKQLEDAGADYVLPSLADTEHIVTLLESLH